MAAEIQEIDPLKGSQAQEKLQIGKQKKDTADQAFKNDQNKDALRSYHEALLYLQGIDKQSLPGITPLPSQSEGDGKTTGQRTEADEMIEKIYSNMSACHVKAGNWRRALDCAEQAIKKNPDNFKAVFRKGKAQAEMGYFEKAEKTFGDLRTKFPADAETIDKELTRLRAQDKVREKKHNEKFRGFLSRPSGSASASSTAAPPKVNGAPAPRSSIPTKPTPEEDGDGKTSAAPILVPSGIEEVPSDDEDKKED